MAKSKPQNQAASPEPEQPVQAEQQEPSAPDAILGEAAASAEPLTADAGDHTTTAVVETTVIEPVPQTEADLDMVSGFRHANVARPDPWQVVYTVEDARALTEVTSGEPYTPPNERAIAAFKEADGTTMVIVGQPDGSLAKAKPQQSTPA
jgi:hypothetical protein